jgi:hypothetical protein
LSCLFGCVLGDKCLYQVSNITAYGYRDSEHLVGEDKENRDRGITGFQEAHRPMRPLRGLLQAAERLSLPALRFGRKIILCYLSASPPQLQEISANRIRVHHRRDLRLPIQVGCAMGPRFAGTLCTPLGLSRQYQAAQAQQQECCRLRRLPDVALVVDSGKIIAG